MVRRTGQNQRHFFRLLLTFIWSKGKVRLADSVVGHDFVYREDKTIRGIEPRADEGGQGGGSPKGSERLAAADESVPRDLG